MKNNPVNRPSSNQTVIDAQEITAGQLQYFLQGPQILSEEQIGLLKSLVDAENQPALMEGYGDATLRDADAHRRTKVRWLNVNENRWVYEIIWAEIDKANALFRYDIVPMQDTMQLALYDAEDQGFFRWHSDIVASDQTRKISIIVPLSNSDEFEGGQLEFNENGAIKRPEQRAGHILMFPSWLLHRVTPVTAGKRYSLVAWVRGPNWR
jgi:PKHD-type hydroxylase